MENVKQNKKQGRKANVEKEQFIQVMLTSTNVNDVLQQLPELLVNKTMKQAKLYVSMRACQLRKQGHNINKFRTGRTTKKTTNAIMEE